MTSMVVVMRVLCAIGRIGIFTSTAVKRGAATARRGAGRSQAQRGSGGSAARLSSAYPPTPGFPGMGVRLHREDLAPRVEIAQKVPFFRKLYSDESRFV